jgi:hypothetical protein
VFDLIFASKERAYPKTDDLKGVPPGQALATLENVRKGCKNLELTIRGLNNKTFTAAFFVVL